MYSILRAMRAIVCIAHERENTVLPYKIAVTLWYLYSLFLSQCLCLYLRASNERPYGIVQTVAILRSDIICFLIFTNCLHELGTAARRAGVQWTPLRVCANGCNVMFGHDMFFGITNCLHEHKKSAHRLRLFTCQKFNTSLNWILGASPIFAVVAVIKHWAEICDIFFKRQQIFFCKTCRFGIELR